MPLTASYSWRQTPTEVVLDVPLRGCSSDTLDIIASDLVLKVSFTPYLLVVDLLREVISAEARLVLDRDAGAVCIYLPKAQPSEWEQLCFDANEEVLILRRQDSLAREQQRQYEAAQIRATVAYEQERAAMKSQMAVEERQRSTLQQRQQDEKEAAQEETLKVLQQLESIKAEREDRPTPETSAPNKRVDVSERMGAKANRKRILQAEEVDVVGAPRILVAPRANTAVTIQFTPRAFPTPLRESKVREEENWMARNYLRLKQGGNRGDPNRPFVERDPAWLKDKGDAFAKAGDWPSADAAYSAALDADGSALDVLLNRSLARLQLDKKGPCVEDCMSIVSRLLDTPVNIDNQSLGGLYQALEGRVSMASTLSSKSRGHLLKALGRTVLSCFRAGAFEEAYHTAVALRLFDAAGDIMAEGVEQVLSALTTSEECKKVGDSCMRAGDAQVALHHYDKATAMEPFYVQAILNKAAALHSIGQWQDCLTVCERIAALLKSAPVWSSVTLDVACITPLPLAGTALHQQCKVRAEVRITDCREKLGMGSDDLAAKSMSTSTAS